MQRELEVLDIGPQVLEDFIAPFLREDKREVSAVVTEGAGIHVAQVVGDLSYDAVARAPPIASVAWGHGGGLGKWVDPNKTGCPLNYRSLKRVHMGNQKTFQSQKV